MKKIFNVKNIAIAFVLLFAAVGVIILIMMSGWKEYKNDEFGFSFRYPRNWYVSRELPSKKDFDAGNYEHGDFEGIIFFIDPRIKGPYTGCTKNMGCPQVPTPGYVEVDFYKKLSETIPSLPSDYEKSAKAIFGSRIGYTSGFSDVTFVHLEKGDYVFNIVMDARPKSGDLLERIKAVYLHLVGSAIVTSFKFD